MDTGGGQIVPSLPAGSPLEDKTPGGCAGLPLAGYLAPSHGSVIFDDD